MRDNKKAVIITSIILLFIIIASVICVNKYFELNSKEISKANNNLIENINSEEKDSINNTSLTINQNEIINEENSKIDNNENNISEENKESITVLENDINQSNDIVGSTFINTTKLEEFSEETYKLSLNNTLESDNKYATKRLLVTTENKENFDTYGAKSVICFNKLSVLTYETEEETEKAYKSFLEDNSIKSVEIDSLVETSSITKVEEVLDRVENGIENEIKGNNSVVVAVLDSGIDLSNILFDNRI